MKKRLIVVIGCLAAIFIVAGFSALITASGTVTGSTASSLTFTQPIRRVLILNNRNASTNAAYFKFNDNATTPTVSTTVYDLCLDQNEQEILRADFLSANPVIRVSVYTAQTTPTVHVVGW